MIADYSASRTDSQVKQFSRNNVQGSTNSAWQQGFLTLLPRIRRHAKLRFRGLSPELREELIQETIARALLDYVRLVERGKEHLAYATPLARYAVAQVRNGRRVGTRLNGCDVSSEYCRGQKGVSLESLDRRDETTGDWLEILVEDRCTTPAEIAAARIDVCQWLKTLPQRTLQLAEWLAAGETTSGAAQMFGVSRSRISQLRRTLEESWVAFQQEGTPVAR